MSEREAVRRLVKSPPELWAQCSDPAALARHLSGFGEIRITRLEPESTVAWEGESASGTVTLEASGWGTKVRLTAAPPVLEPEPERGREQSAPVLITSDPEPESRGLSALLRGWRRRRRDAAAPPTPAEIPALAIIPVGERDLGSELEAALDSLGQAHHRPYSRN